MRQNGVVKPEGREAKALQSAVRTQAGQPQSGASASQAVAKNAKSSASPVWWDVPANIARGERIGLEEGKNWPNNPPDDSNDAMRHAEWNRRMTEELGPVWAYLFSLWHEADNLVHRSHGLGEAWKDMRNDRVGIRAGLSGTPVRPGDLHHDPSILFRTPHRTY